MRPAESDYSLATASLRLAYLTAPRRDESHRDYEEYDDDATLGSPTARRR